MENVSRNDAKKTNFQNKYLLDGFELINMYQETKMFDWLMK